MASFSLSSSSKHPRFDTIIGLDVAGELFYCRKSTLLGENPSYFAARFGPDSMMDPQLDHIDEKGREIYFVDRNPVMFKYVLDYLRMQKLPPEIGTFQETPNLWRSLRNEAEFYALDGLTSLLKVTFSCSPSEDGGKGILYWLGTNKGKNKYHNPYKLGVIDVSGWFDSFSTLGEHDPSWGSSERKEFFVQYRPISERALLDDEIIWPGVGNVLFPCLTGCNHSSQRLPVVVDMRKNTISPTHYSLRYGACRGMDGNWNFEASTDGENWVLLHEGRRTDGHNLTYERLTQRHALGENEWFQEIRQGRDAFTPIANWPEVYCDYMERHYRHTWEINNSTGQFFRYFRIIGADVVGDGGGCIHCIGLEIYGKVHEE
ncbi:hypothetical protein ACHAXR_013155 [Thalassiosira sp. AJA248-18]